MEESSVTIVGLPGSGKTTYLAALWAILKESPDKAVLRLRELGSGDLKYLNEIAKTWRSAHEQKRTLQSVQTVALHMIGPDEEAVSVTFPDPAGETFKRMWADRSCSAAVFDQLVASGLMVFVHADKITYPNYIRDAANIAAQFGVPLQETEPAPWDVEKAPTQVQLVGLLDALRSPPFDDAPRRVAVVISAWDRAEGEGKSPERYLAERMPLLAQYIGQNLAGWEWRVYGVSAQGGEFDPDEDDRPLAPHADRLRQLDTMAERIKMVGPEGQSNDLTEPLAWVLG